VPDLPKWPNWSRVEATTSPAVDDVALQAVEAMREVFGLRDNDLVLTKLFPSGLRGDSPASPDHRDEPGDVARAADTDEANPHPGPDATEDEMVARAMEFIGLTWDRQGTAPDWIDPNGGPDDEDPDICPDPTADDPPFADRELGADDRV
jgi:hypothetical protein